MSQYDFGTIDAATKSGTVLAADLNAWRTALHSLHRGASRPSYAIGGMLWGKDVDANTVEIYYYDGTDDILIGTLDTSNNVFLPIIARAESKSGNFTIGSTDRAKTFVCTATLTVTMAAANIRSGFHVNIKNEGSGTVTINRVGTDTISTADDQAATSVALAAGESVTLVADGTSEWHAVAYVKASLAKTNTAQNWPKAQRAGHTSKPSSTGAITVDCNADANNLYTALSENVTGITINNPADGLTLKWTFKQDTTNRTITGWPAAVAWQTSDGAAPTMPTGSGKTMTITLVYNSTLAKWIGQVASEPAA
jgi:hypothetical protein